jgi:hypothetical protein
MRSSVALAGSAAVLMAVLVTGCGGDTSGSPVQVTTTTASSAATGGGGGAGETSLPAIDTKQLDEPSELESLAGDWRQDTTSKPTQAHVESDGKLTLIQGGQTIKGQLVWLGDRHFRILLVGALDAPKPPEITADLSADGNTMTVHSSEEPGPIVYKRVG